MRDPLSPSLRLRRLASELRRSRLEAKLTVAQVAKELKWSSAKVSKMETTESKRIKPSDLDRLMDLYRIEDPDTRKAMQALARDARERGWWSKYKEVFGDRALPDFEAEASVLRTFEASTVPGLLQTPEYAEAIFKGGRYIGQDEVRRRVEFRMARQNILTKYPPTQLRTVIDEAALRRMVGGRDVMLGQMTYLLHMAQLPNIDVQVLPYEAGAHAALAAPFTILDFSEPLDTPVVYVGTVTEALFLEEAEDIDRYSATFGDVQGSALSTAQSAAFITDVAASLESQP